MMRCLESSNAVDASTSSESINCLLAVKDRGGTTESDRIKEISAEAGKERGHLPGLNPLGR